MARTQAPAVGAAWGLVRRALSDGDLKEDVAVLASRRITDLDRIEAADLIDDLQASVPSTRR